MHCLLELLLIGIKDITIESFSRFLRDRDRESLYKALHFFGIIVIFALGAGVGGVISARLGLGTIWLSVMLLVIAALMMTKETR